MTPCASHDKMVEAVAAIQAMEKAQEVAFGKIGEIYTAIHGNGTPGLKQDVAILKQKMETIDRKEESRKADRRVVFPQVLPWTLFFISILGYLMKAWDMGVFHR